MNLLNINIDSHKQDLIDAFTEIFGIEYKNPIEHRINSLFLFPYITKQNLETYIIDIKLFKRLEAWKKFINQINIEYPKDITYKQIETIITNYLSPTAFEDEQDYKKLLSFKYQTNDEKILDEQIRFINFLLKQEIITKENYQAYKQTNEYKNIIETINKYLSIFDTLKAEYQIIYEKYNIKEYEIFIQNEEKRSKELQKKSLNNLYLTLREKLPPNLQEALNNNLKRIDFNLEFKSIYEYFSKEDEEKLNNPNITTFSKNIIYLNRIKALTSLGIEITEEYSYNNAQEIYKKYKDTIEVKKIIPSFELINYLTLLRKEYYENYMKEFIFTSPGTKEIQETFKAPESRNFIYELIKDEKIVVNAGTNEEQPVSLLFFTIRNGSLGLIDYTLIHELVHITTTTFINPPKTERYCGIELMGISNYELNPYNNKKRKYEALNEILTDFFALKIRNILHKKEIYIIENKELIIKNINDYNYTSPLLQNLITPLIKFAKKEVIESFITGKPEIIINKIGYENFEELNDIINYISKLFAKKDEAFELEYSKALTKLNEIYENMSTFITHKNL